MARVLVILPTGSYRATDFVEAATALNVELAIASEEEPPLGFDDRFVRIDCRDVEDSARAIADLAGRTPIDSIVSADDAGVVIAARASELVGLAHNPPSAAEATRDKERMRHLLDAGEIPQPVFNVATDLRSTVAAAEGIGFPVVIKPVDLSASRGVIRADDATQAAAAFERIHEVFGEHIERAGDRVLVERFVPGPEVSLEGMLWNGHLETLAIFDKPDPLDGPYFQETMFVAPTGLDRSTVAELERVTATAVTAMGLTHGPIHAELRLEAGRPVVIEIAARTIGGLCGRALTFGLLGSSLEEMVIRQSLGIDKRGRGRTPGATGAYMIPIPAAGRLVAISGVEDAAAVPGVWSVEITTRVGDRVTPPPDGDRYLGFVFARAGTREEVVAALRSAGGAMSLEIEAITG